MSPKPPAPPRDEFDLLNGLPQPGLNVIEAGAGTGKTWTIAHLVPRLLISGRIERLDQLLLVSFTEDATRELAGRVRETLADLLEGLLERHPRPDQCEDPAALLTEALRAARARNLQGRAILFQALLDLPEKDQRRRMRALLAARLDADRLNVETIHSLCRRVLGDEGFLCGTPSGLEIAVQESEERAQALRDVWRQDLAPDPLLAALALSQGWKSEDDAKAWNSLKSADSEALHPLPQALGQAKTGLTQALAGLLAAAPGLATLEKILRRPGLVLNNAGKRLDFARLARDLENLDPSAPSPQALDAATELAGAEEWIRNQGKTNQAALADLAAHPLPREAAALQVAQDALAWAWRGHALTAARRRLDQGFRRANQISFNGIIAQLHRALHGPQGEELAQRLRQRWRLALVDESQDTDQRQLAIFEAVFNRAGEMENSLILIGDPKQSIYSFRGADLDAYLAVRKRPGVPVHLLTRTQRPAAALARALNRLFGRARPNPLASPDLEVPDAVPARAEAELPLPQGETPRLVAALAGPECAGINKPERRRRAAEATADAVAALLGRPVPEPGAPGRRVEPGDCAVLVRDRFQAQAVREALAAKKIPAVTRDQGDVFDGETADELRSVLDAALNPSRVERCRSALATRLLGFDAARLRALSGTQEESSWLERFRSWRRVWEERGVGTLLERLDREAGLRQNLAGRPDAERRLTDLPHLGELLAAAEAGQSLTPERLLRWFDACRAEAALVQDRPAEARRRRLETDAAAVQVLTTHNAKGLEFEYCFLPFLGSAKAPEEKSGWIVRLPGGTAALADPKRLDPGEHARLGEQVRLRALEEDLRLAYVALTRAKRRVWFLAGWLGYGPGRSVEGPSALDWILRAVRPDESAAQWYDRMEGQKKAASNKNGGAPAAPCEHEAALRSLAERDPDLIAVQGLPDRAPEWPGAPALDPDLAVETAPAPPSGWAYTSFTALAGSGDGARGHADPERDDGEALGEPLALAALPGGSRVGECLHEALERWNFRDAPEHLGPTLRRHGLDLRLADGRDAQALLEEALPRWAQAEVPGLGPLREAASDERLSEWHFVLPLGGRGLDGAGLAEVFRTHADPRLRAYAPSLAALAPQSVRGMLQGYLDRLLRQGEAWGVADWKSNRLGGHARDFREERLFEEAASHHYLLQLHLYLAALRRHLRTRGGRFRLDGGSLVFVRALEPGTSRGILRFAADEGFLDRLDALLDGGRA